MNSCLGRRSALVAAGLLAGAVVLIGGPATAADSPRIDHAAPTSDGKVDLLLTVPGTQPIDLASVKVTIDGKSVPASAQNASDSSSVRRTAVLAIDTSNSMKGAKFTQAKSAAMSFLDTAPADVYVGAVAFDKTVRVLGSPSLDRAPLRDQIGKLTLARSTALNQGVLKAIQTSGTDGSRSVLLLSDGKDTTGTSLSSVEAALKKANVKVDVVALQQSGKGIANLTSIAEAGHGTIIRADVPGTLTRTFRDEAKALARQVLVTADVPKGQSLDANVAVDISDGSTSYATSAYVSVRTPAKKPKGTSAAVSRPAGHSAAFEISAPMLAAVVGLVGLGLVGIVATMLFGDKPSEKSVIAEQIANYGAGAAQASGKRVAQPQTLTQRATKQAAAMLANNRSLEAKIANRLEGASIALKPAEWLLVHATAAVSISLVLLLVGGGKVAFLIVGLGIGAFLPWWYLGRKKKKRIKAFQAMLPDTLQLMAGSLSAGLSLAQSVDTIVREGGEPITSEFRRVIVESRLGVSVEDAMEGVGQRMESRDFEWVVMAIRIQREVGGNLSELLLTVAETLREREYIRRHVQALSAEGRLSCYVLGGLPPVFLAYLSLSKWDYVKPLFTTPMGYGLSFMLVMLLSVGVFWMSKVSKVEL